MTLDSGNTKDITSKPFPIVAIGASAGGIEAVTALLKEVSPTNGMAYVIVQHLSPTHQSILPEIFEKKTTMKVHRVKNGIKIEPDNVYVIPPDSTMSVVDGVLTLSQRVKKDGAFHPIDHFFTTLAAVYQNKSIGIVLSGTATDGTGGLKAIKAEGGITFAQDDTAKFQSMPHSAVESGQVDFILPPEKIAIELNKIMKLSFMAEPPIEVIKNNETLFTEILVLIQQKRGVDFTSYKNSTIYRRILRRVALNKNNTVADYLLLLKENDKEINALYNDLLINVTSFFRESSFFNALSKKIFPELIKNTKYKDPIRIWIPACSSGEEAYSVAICMFEYLESQSTPTSFNIFATDLNELSVEKARAGIYDKSTLQHLPSDYLKKYFIELDGHYQIIKAIRDACIFATHNLLSDPPFSRIDLISCQNVMIYLEPSAQQKILQSFHYAIKPGGYLILGKSESIGGAGNLFEQADKDLQIYTKRNGINNVAFEFSAKPYPLNHNEEISRVNVLRESDIEKETDKILLSKYVPSSVVVNKDMEIVRFHGQTSNYLQPASGKASLHLLKMVKDEFLFDLRSLFQKVKKEGTIVRKEGIRVTHNDIVGLVTLEVVPIRPSSKEPYYLILFKEEEISNAQPLTLTENISDTDKNHRIIALERELRDAREQMKSMSEDFEATREELQSSNEEVLSSNEELQSINEELETSKEELQSTNEELTTINEELQSRNGELNEAFEYRKAIVETIREPLLVLDNSLHITTANKAFYEIFKLLKSETEGFNLNKIANGQLDIPLLKIQLADVIIKNKSFHNIEITQTFEHVGERSLLFSGMRMGNSIDKDNRILLVIEDITQRRKAENDLKNSHYRNLNILNSISDVFISIDNNWRYTFINKQAEEFIGRHSTEVLGKNMWEVMPNYANTEFYTHLINAMRTKEFTSFEFFDVRTKQWLNFRLYPSKETLSIYSNNITEHKLAANFAIRSKERYQTFISKSTEGIWRFELTKPISVKFSKQVQLQQLLKNAVLKECNDSIAIMHGYSKASDIINNTLEELFVTDKDREVLEQLLNSSYQLIDAEIQEVNEVNKKNKYFLLNMMCIIENDMIVRLWGTQRDVTEHHMAEIHLRDTQQKLKLALSVGAVSAWLWDIKKDELKWSVKQIDDKEIELNENFEKFINSIYPDDIKYVRKRIKTAIDNKVDINIEYRIKNAEGRITWSLLKANITYDHNQQATEISGVNIDITERKLLEKQKEEFIGIASHELKTPVTSIKAYAEILQEILEEKNDEQSADLVKKMHRQVNRLTSLIVELLDVTKIAEGQLKLQKSNFDFNAMIAEVADDMQTTTKKHAIETKLNVQQSLYADKNKINEVLVNLIGNAIKYSPGGDNANSKIIISAHTDDNNLTVSIEDFGIGIPQQLRTRIFDRFFRANDPLAHTFPGLGLGLFICAEIIKRHKGKIWIANNRVLGSEFVFTLPLNTADEKENSNS
jgi:PAS domain S-box-containing protein